MVGTSVHQPALPSHFASRSRYRTPRAVIQFADRTADAALAGLAKYVTENANPENANSVVAVGADAIRAELARLTQLRTAIEQLRPQAAERP